MRCRSAARTERPEGIGPGTVLTALLTVTAFAVPVVPAAAAATAATSRTGTVVAAPNTIARAGTDSASEESNGADPAKSGHWIPSWTEEFSGTGMTPDCGAYGGVHDEGTNAWSPEQVSVEADRLHLGIVRQENRGKPFTSGGVGCWGRAQTYGRFEIRAKAPRGQGLNSYLGLWPEDGSDSDWTGIELFAPDTEIAYVTNGWGHDADRVGVPGRYTDTFHTYVIEWAPELTKVTQDGRTLYRSSRSYTGSRWLGLVIGTEDGPTGPPAASAHVPADFQIDRVSVWSYTGFPTEDASSARALSVASAVSRDTLRGEPTTQALAPVVASDPTVTVTPDQDGASGESLDELPPSVAAYTTADPSGDGTAVNLSFSTTDWGGVPWLIAALAAVVAVGTFRCSPYLARFAVRRGERSRRDTQHTHG
jgi:beta-glucanase (GH16 family)